MPGAYGNNPYGTLGPSPQTVNRITPRRRPGRTPSTRPKGQSIDQWANAQVAKLIAAQVKAIEEQRQIYLNELDKRAKLEADRGLALGRSLAAMDMPGRMSSIYGGAAHDIAGLAQGFSGQIRGIAEGDAAQQAHMLSGTGQEGAVRNEGVGMADVNYGAQGYIPGRSMAETGAAFAQQAALEPSFAARIGQLEAGRVHSEGLEGLDEFTKAMIEIRSQRPELVQDMLDRRRAMVQDERKFKMDERDAERDWYLKLAALEMQRGNNARANQYLALAAARENRQVGAENRRALKDKGLDAAGNLLPGYAYKNGRVVKVSTARGSKGSSSSTVPGTPAYNAAAVQKVGAAQKNLDADIAAMVTKPTAADIKGGADPFSTKKPGFDQAFGRLWGKYKYLATTKAAKAALRDAIVRALAAAGIQKMRSAPVGSSPGHL